MSKSFAYLKNTPEKYSNKILQYGGHRRKAEQELAKKILVDLVHAAAAEDADWLKENRECFIGEIGTLLRFLEGSSENQLAGLLSLLQIIDRGEEKLGMKTNALNQSTSLSRASSLRAEKIKVSLWLLAKYSAITLTSLSVFAFALGVFITTRRENNAMLARHFCSSSNLLNPDPEHYYKTIANSEIVQEFARPAISVIGGIGLLSAGYFGNKLRRVYQECRSTLANLSGDHSSLGERAAGPSHGNQ